MPLLRKDFVLDRYQLLEARHAGADCVLLIAEILPGDELPRLFRQATELGLQALVELYDGDNLRRVLDCGARLVGINNRDLRLLRGEVGAHDRIGLEGAERRVPGWGERNQQSSGYRQAARRGGEGGAGGRNSDAGG